MKRLIVVMLNIILAFCIFAHAEQNTIRKGYQTVRFFLKVWTARI